MTSLPTEAPRSEIDILRDCTDQLRRRLPTDWRISVQPETGARNTGFDALVTIGTGYADDARFLVEVKRLVTRSDVVAIASRLRDAAARDLIEAAPMVMTRYLPPSTRGALDEQGVSFADATGNMLLTSPRPHMFVRDRGADNDPWRGPGRPRANLAGEPAARIVRTLARRPGPWSARELVKASGASTGATYRVLEFLQDEGLVDKVDARFLVTDWADLLRRWSRDYGFFSNNRTRRYLEPRGVQAFLHKLATTPAPTYAITGSAAAAQWAPYAPTRAVMVYTEPAADSSELWGLKPTDVGANVFVARAEYDVVFTDTSVSDDGYVIVAPEQAAVDLLTGPDRNPVEGEELLTWMTLNEPAWRRG